MILHRRVYLIAAFVAVLTAAIAALGLLEMSRSNGQSDRLIAGNAQSDLLAAAQRDIVTSQVQFTSSLEQPKGTAARRAIFVTASAQQQRGVDEWNRLRRTAARRVASSTQAVQLSTDLRELPYFSTGSTAGSARGTASTTVLDTTPAEVALAAIRVASDFDAVRQLQNAWWAAQLAQHRDTGRNGIIAVVVAGSLVMLGVLAALTSLARAARRRDEDLAERDRDLERVARSNEFEARLQRALELSANEDGVYAVVEQALDEVVPELDVEMLLADSSRAHFQQLVSTAADASRGCSVDSPTQCPAAQRGEVLAFESSTALDACPYLKQQPKAASAICVPVSVSGLTVGVVHAAGPRNAPPDAQKRTALELISRRASDRIGMMRAFSDSETQASTDPLTGLPNRRSLENSVRRLRETGNPYAVAFGDLDHFKTVNDKHGHAAGDHALRVFARVLRDQLRPVDIFGRYGGEEFLIVLPLCDAPEATEVLERIRASLSVTLVSAECPPFTVSFGLALGNAAESFEDTVSAADGALLDAKREGRDRIVLARPVRADAPAAGELRSVAAR